MFQAKHTKANATKGEELGVARVTAKSCFVEEDIESLDSPSSLLNKGTVGLLTPNKQTPTKMDTLATTAPSAVPNLWGYGLRRGSELPPSAVA